MLALWGCGPQTLEGSLTEVLDLRYHQAQTLSDDTQVSVSFTTPQGAGLNVVLKVSAQVGDLIIVPGAVINLAEAGPNGAPRGTLSRDVLNAPFHSFPPIRTGELRFDGIFKRGATVPGFFAVTFAEGSTPASGHTVFGKFSARAPP